MSVDRSLAPKVQGFEDYILRKPDAVDLSVHSKLLHLHDSNVNVVKCEFIFRAGKIYDRYPADSLLTGKLLPFNRLSSGQKLQELVDSFGGYLDISTNDDYFTVTLYCISKCVNLLLPGVLEMFQITNFQKDDFETIQQVTREELEINFTKGKNIANQKLKKQLFDGSQYGRPIVPVDIGKSSLEKLQSFHELSLITPILISVSGNYESSTIQKLLESFKSTPAIQQQNEALPIPAIDSVEGKSEQTSMRFGSKLPISEVQRLDTKVYNMMLGGYFGSRLMTTLREKHGLTYGISSSINQNESYGFWIIQSEVKKESTKQAVDLVLQDIKRVAESYISEKELRNCINQLIGDLVSSTSNVFSLAHVHKQLLLNKQSHSIFDNYVSKLGEIKIQNIQNVANQFAQLNLVTIS